MSPKKIGTGPRAVSDAEKGKLSTGLAVYAALLWAYDLLDPVAALADPARDQEGLHWNCRAAAPRAPQGGA
ncbi:MAG: hypothetical protein M5U09_01685 [Gammaproteobacteria bacterium]|nr:hypothetical protein [Gammaproteobacteria bacterium]